MADPCHTGPLQRSSPRVFDPDSIETLHALHPSAPVDNRRQTFGIDRAGQDSLRFVFVAEPPVCQGEQIKSESVVGIGVRSRGQSAHRGFVMSGVKILDAFHQAGITRRLKRCLSVEIHALSQS